AQGAAKLRQTQEALTSEDQRLRQLGADQEKVATEQAAQAEFLQTRAAQLSEMQDRLHTERVTLREREAPMPQAEPVGVALQDQLRRRAEELAERQKALAEQTRKRDEEFAALEARRVQIEVDRRVAEESVLTRERDSEEKARTLDTRGAELEAYETETRA